MVYNATGDNLQYRLAAVLTLGFLCEDFEPGFIQPDIMNRILGAILENIMPNQIDLTRISVRAFARAAPSTAENFKND